MTGNNSPMTEKKQHHTSFRLHSRRNMPSLPSVDGPAASTDAHCAAHTLSGRVCNVKTCLVTHVRCTRPIPRRICHLVSCFSLDHQKTPLGHMYWSTLQPPLRITCSEWEYCLRWET